MSDEVRPLTEPERRARGLCTCPQKVDPGPPPQPCGVHPDGVDLDEEARSAAGLVFYDDRRNRFVTWADAVEGMRQRRYAGAHNDDLMQFTWVMLIRLLEALHDPLGEPADNVTQALADDLVAWSDAALDADDRRWLLGFARGGGTPALCRMFRTVARTAVGTATGAEVDAAVGGVVGEDAR